jgi:hypothetical protein
MMTFSKTGKNRGRVAIMTWNGILTFLQHIWQNHTSVQADRRGIYCFSLINFIFTQNNNNDIGSL